MHEQGGRTGFGGRVLLASTVLAGAGGSAVTPILIVAPSVDLRGAAIVAVAAALPGAFVSNYRGRLRKGRWSRDRRTRIRRWLPAAAALVVAGVAGVFGVIRAHRWIGNPRMMDGRYYLNGNGKMTEVTRDQYLQVANSGALVGVAVGLLFAASAWVGLIGWKPDRIIPGSAAANELRQRRRKS